MSTMMDPKDEDEYADKQGNELEPTLLAETMTIMTGYCTNDITFIGLPDDDYACTWEEFAEMAKYIRVNKGYPHVCIYDLEIHFKDGGRLIREIDLSGYDRGWKRMNPTIISYSVKEFRKLTTLNKDELKKEKNEILELQRLKTKYES